MSKLSQIFENKKAFIPFITAGDPSLDLTGELILGMEKAGADLIELGIPFSDPVAEGPTIQNANIRSLSGGTTADKIFDMLEELKEKIKIPIAFMTYINPIFAYGTDKFLQRCKSAKVSALIVPDLPFEERDELFPFCQKYDITLISMVAPTSDHRIKMIAENAEGFIYCVSSMGVTGVRQEFDPRVIEMVKQIKANSRTPCAIGFGISTPSQASKMAEYYDGVIVGSAIINIIEKYGEGCLPHVTKYVKEMIDALPKY